MGGNRGRCVVAGVAVIGAAALLAGCAGRSPELIVEARDKVAAARADPDIPAYAPEKLEEAEQSLAQTESAFDAAAPQDELDHLAYVTVRRVAIADALADERAARAEIAELGEEQERLRIDSRDRQIEALESQLAELEARETDRGLVVTLGDILFDVDRAQLNPGGELQVARLADALHQMPERNVLIEGHADSSGTDAYNEQLSQRRAEAVEDLLILHGIEPTRAVTRSYGEGFPVASNDTAAGRQQNRRVEVVILNPGAASFSDAVRARLAALPERLIRLAVTPRGSAIGAGHPEHVGRAVVVEVAGEHEQVVREPVEVAHRLGIDRRAGRELGGQALGAADHGARLVEEGRGGPAARQDEGVERLQRRVHGVDLGLEPGHLARLDAQRVRVVGIGAGAAEVGAEVEQIVLDPRQHRVGGGLGVQAREADRGVGLVDRAVGGDPQIVLGDPAAVAERGPAAVAALGVDLGQADQGPVSGLRRRVIRG